LFKYQLAAYNVNISKDEPSAVWVILAVVGTALDAAAVAKISKTLVNAGRTYNSTGDLIQAKQTLKEAGLDAGTEYKVMKALDEEKSIHSKDVTIDSAPHFLSINFTKGTKISYPESKLDNVNPALLSKAPIKAVNIRC
jgi:uncharacterized protein YpuA (DUF1002 family)